MDAEKVNADNHLIFVNAGHVSSEDALVNEREVLNAWCSWYQEAFESVTTLVDIPSEELLAAIDSAKTEMNEKTDECLAYAEQILAPEQQIQNHR